MQYLPPITTVSLAQLPWFSVVPTVHFILWCANVLSKRLNQKNHIKYLKGNLYEDEV